jgi:hypothetical protein
MWVPQQCTMCVTLFQTKQMGEWANFLCPYSYDIGNNIYTAAELTLPGTGQQFRFNIRTYGINVSVLYFSSTSQTKFMHLH